MKKGSGANKPKISRSVGNPEYAVGKSDLAVENIELRAALEDFKLKNKLLGLRNQELEQENSNLRRGRSATEDLLRSEVHRRDSEIIALKVSLEAKEKQLEWFRRQKFDQTTERNADSDKGEEGDDGSTAQNKSSKGRGQKSGEKGHGRNKKTEVDTVVEYIDIPGGCTCGTCGKAYRLMPRTEASPLTEIEVSILRTIFQRLIYVSQCDCEGRKIRVAEPPAKLFPRTEIGNSLWVWILVHKFLHGMPQNRIIKQLSLWNLSLPAGTITGGCKLINDLLDPIFEALLNHCRGADFWNADKTTWRIFGQDKQRWWFWLIASSDTVVYLLDPSRSKKVPNEFFAGSAGILMTDRLASYKGLQEAIIKAWCWAHMRRDIFNIYKGVPVLKKWAKDWLLEITELYVLQHKLFKLWKEGTTTGEKWDEASAAVKDHVQKLQKLWETQLAESDLHQEQAKVLRSFKRHWKGLIVFLNDPRIPLDNNRAERLLRNPVILRKNSFGSGAPWAGYLAAKIFSIFQTWLINGLDPEKLLLDFFRECSKTPGIPPPDISDFLPWKMSQERKTKYALPESYTRPG
jgi:transposase